jgi:hypothetical protein
MLSGKAIISQMFFPRWVDFYSFSLNFDRRRTWVGWLGAGIEFICDSLLSIVPRRLLGYGFYAFRESSRGNLIPLRQ